MSTFKKLTTAAGCPVGNDQSSLAVGGEGPLLLQDSHLIEKLAHLNRERIPERVVHAKGAGAHGFFEVTRDMSAWTKAKFLQNVGKRTPVFVRFSTTGGEKGSADSVRDARGFAVKFYTEEGNYDLVGLNTPVFFLRDPIKFADLVHSQKKNPQTNCIDPNTIWDFFSRNPETLHQITVQFSSRGTPHSYRHMHGFGGHTFKWVNAEGKAFWIKYHFKTEAGITNRTAQTALQVAGENPDYATQDLFEHIDGGGEAVWRVYVQIMPLADASTYRYNPFDLTKVWTYQDYPLHLVGRLVLNRNPKNYFAEVEQAAFSPANLVAGIEPSPDRMLQGRMFAYPDAHRYRLGANHAQLPVNCPYASQVHHYQRDGAMALSENGGSEPNYGTNSAGGPEATASANEQPFVVQGVAQRTEVALHDEDNDYAQPGALYRLLSEEERSLLVANLVDSLKPARQDIQMRQLCHFFQADPNYGLRVAQGLGLETFAQSALQKVR
jgi:catalase